jgi:hypothetical protein
MTELVQELWQYARQDHPELEALDAAMHAFTNRDIEAA